MMLPPPWVLVWMVCSEKYVGRETHGACGAQREMVHLLGERSHDTGWVKRQAGLYGRCWGDHSTLVKKNRASTFRAFLNVVDFSCETMTKKIQWSQIVHTSIIHVYKLNFTVQKQQYINIGMKRHRHYKRIVTLTDFKFQTKSVT